MDSHLSAEGDTRVNDEVVHGTLAHAWGGSRKAVSYAKVWREITM